MTEIKSVKLKNSMGKLNVIVETGEKKIGKLKENSEVMPSMRHRETKR